MALLWQWRIPSDLTTQDATSLRATRLSERLTQVLLNNRIFINRTQQELGYKSYNLNNYRLRELIPMPEGARSSHFSCIP